MRRQKSFFLRSWLRSLQKVLIEPQNVFFTTSQYRYRKEKFYADFESPGKVAKVFLQKNLDG
jgi:hypothetical protein